MDKKNIPSNSHVSRVQKVTKGTVKRKKQTLGKQFIGMFTGEDSKSVGEYILHDVVIPAVKSTLVDVVQGGIEMFLYGERKPRGGHTSYYKSYNSYNNAYKPQKPQQRHTNKTGEYVVDTRHEATDVLHGMMAVLEEYGQVSLADLHDLLGVTGDFTDNDYGWTNLAQAKITRVRDGYLIDLPRPRYLN